MNFTPASLVYEFSDSTMMRILICLTLVLLTSVLKICAQRKAVFIILDGISADVVERVETPILDEIAEQGGYTRAYVGGEKDGYSQSPTISAVGYNHLLTGTWTNKHNVWDNDIKEPNYHYWNIFRIVKAVKPQLKTAIFSTWLDNRTKLIGENLEQAGGIKLDYSFDGFENDETRFPHDSDRKFIAAIDELVSSEAGRYIAENGPDLSWVYLEFTDDMGHMYGDSPQYFEAIKKADAQVGKVWAAIQERQKKYGEEWIIMVTTDHGRDAETGKNHGKQSERERTIWITTNASPLNDRFRQTPAMVDIMPSILEFMQIEIPATTKAEIDGVPFIGNISISNLRAIRTGNTLELTWDAIDKKGVAEIFISTTNLFKDGKTDDYTKLASVKVSQQKVLLDVKKFESDFYKILLKAPHNWCNTWIVHSSN